MFKSNTNKQVMSALGMIVVGMILAPQSAHADENNGRGGVVVNGDGIFESLERRPFVVRDHNLRLGAGIISESGNISPLLQGDLNLRLPSVRNEAQGWRHNDVSYLVLDPSTNFEANLATDSNPGDYRFKTEGFSLIQSEYSRDGSPSSDTYLTNYHRVTGLQYGFERSDRSGLETGSGAHEAFEGNRMNINPVTVDSRVGFGSGSTDMEFFSSITPIEVGITTGERQNRRTIYSSEVEAGLGVALGNAGRVTVAGNLDFEFYRESQNIYDIDGEYSHDETALDSHLQVEGILTYLKDFGPVALDASAFIRRESITDQVFDDSITPETSAVERTAGVTVGVQF